MLKVWKNRLILVIVFYICILKFYQNLKVFEREEALLTVLHQMTEHPRHLLPDSKGGGRACRPL